MGKRKEKHIPAEVPQPMMAEIRCRKCRSPVTPALRLLDAVPARTIDDKEELMKVGETAFAHSTRTLGDTVDRYALSHGLIVNTADLLKTTCYSSSYGCCGYDAHQGPNLLCRNGHLIGSFVDDCCSAHFAHLTLEHCEFFPLPPIPSPQAGPTTQTHP